MASSSKPSSSKRPVPKISTADATPLPRKKLSVRPVDSLNFDLLHQVSFDKRLRELGKPPNAVDSLFLPASAEECSVLVNRWKHLPNTASPAFSLRRYTHPDEVSFREVLEQDTDNSRPDTFYPALLTTFCSTFSHGAVSTAEGFQLYQALAFLQRKFARLIKGHLSKQEIHRRLLDLTALRNFSDSLEYYQLYWHGRQNCPLAAVVLVLLICEFCEEHLSGEEYASRVYDQKARDGPGMSMKTRERLLEDIPDSYELETLALPIPLDPSTREGQLLLTVTGRGSPVDKIVHPHTRKVVAPDPSFQPPPGPGKPAVSTSPPKARLRPPSPDFDEASEDNVPASLPKPRRGVRNFPVTPSVAEEDTGDELNPTDVFKTPASPDVLVLRPSIARAAKTNPKIPEALRKVPTPVPSTKRGHSPAEAKLVPPVAESSCQKASSTIAPPEDPSALQDEEPFLIQEGDPAYHHGDDTKVTAHSRFLTNPRFQPKTPFSQLISNARENNKRGSKIPFLRAPKWKVTDELRDFGAFANIGDTTFSLQGLSRFGYASSRFLWPSNNKTLPSPESLYSTNNCLTCTSRGEVCESTACLWTTIGIAFALSMTTSKVIPMVGYAASLEQYAVALDHITKLQASFAPLFHDAQQALLHGMQKVRSTGFDLNVVLSRWAEDNPDLPLDYDTLTWLATLFGWDSSCNLVDYLATAEDRARLEAFMHDSLPSPADPVAPATLPAVSSSLLDAPEPPESPRLSRRRPAAATPSNFFSDHEFHTPLPESTIVDDEGENEAENDEKAEEVSRVSAGRSLLTEYEDESDEDGEPDVETIEPHASEVPNSVKNRK
ncbi:hypothetical protein F5878DRAFT_667581 [Lentinula raphanica]|uniref:Uncharacterized protein n=1 Tax=Lentinula raphanica TaxID=153919 RepID=A0AA38NVI3_9AGAR|nr:hypothetical protein F5878DRAFT_667581 [Lentinula raphanica]